MAPSWRPLAWWPPEEGDAEVLLDGLPLTAAERDAITPDTTVVIHEPVPVGDNLYLLDDEVL